VFFAPGQFFMKKTKFLIIRLSSIGDIVLTSSLIRCLKEQVENAEIHFVTKSKYGELLFANPYVDKIHFLNRNISQLLQELKLEKPDYIIDLHKNFRSFRIKQHLGAPVFSFEKLNLQKWLRIKLGIDLLPDLHVVDRYFQTVRSFNVVDDDQGLDYYIPQGQSFDFSQLPESFRTGYVAFIIGGTYLTKRLPEDKVIEICNQIDLPVVLIGGKQEIPAGHLIDRNGGKHILNLTGKTTVNESASLVREARIILTNDTGMMHIAAAFHKKILSFWGNTIPKFGMTPYKPHPVSTILEVNGLSCRPCSKLGFQKCPKQHFRCMNDMDVLQAVEWIRENF
jgi:ADP-heptose:LPS heptosyltransferase